MVSGLAITLVPVVSLSPAAGDHEYVSAPLAISITEPPGQITGLGGITLIVNVNGVHVTEAVPKNSKGTFVLALLKLVKQIIYLSLHIRGRGGS